jgi:hypothetical protein
MASNYLLPACLILLTVGTDMDALRRLGFMPLASFLAGAHDTVRVVNPFSLRLAPILIRFQTKDVL